MSGRQILPLDQYEVTGPQVFLSSKAKKVPALSSALHQTNPLVASHLPRQQPRVRSRRFGIKPKARASEVPNTRTHSCHNGHRQTALKTATAKAHSTAVEETECSTDAHAMKSLRSKYGNFKKRPHKPPLSKKGDSEKRPHPPLRIRPL